MKSTDNVQPSRAPQPVEPIPEEPTAELVQVEPVPFNRPLPRAVRIEITPEPILDEPEIISLTGCLKTYHSGSIARTFQLLHEILRLESGVL